MYTTLLFFHSITRWLVLASLLYSICRSWYGWKAGKVFTRHDDTSRHVTATIAHVQLLLGLGLYFISPIIKYFLDNFKEAVHNRQIRFFGMEHSLMMFLGIVFISIGASAAKRKTTDSAKFKTMAIWFTIGLLFILSSVPWPFSPLVSRPWLRSF